MRTQEDVLKQLRAVRKGIIFWSAESKKRDEDTSPGYQEYARDIVSKLRLQETMLRWFLGEGVELPPAG